MLSLEPRTFNEVIDCPHTVADAHGTSATTQISALRARLDAVRGQIYSRFNTWAKAGVFQTVMDALIAEAASRGQIGLELVSVDSTIVRTHHESAGTGDRRGDPRRAGTGADRGKMGPIAHTATGAAGDLPQSAPDAADADRSPARPRKLSNRPNLGYSYLHNAVDDHSRLAYTEILPDETKLTAVAFWTRAQNFFQANGITVQRVLTNNGACYRSQLWRDTLTDAGITHTRIRPYRPQTNGKVERFNLTLLDEWAYARPYQSETERQRALPR